MLLDRDVQTTFWGGKFPNFLIFLSQELQDLIVWVQNASLYFLDENLADFSVLSLSNF